MMIPVFSRVGFAPRLFVARTRTVDTVPISRVRTEKIVVTLLGCPPIDSVMRLCIWRMTAQKDALYPSYAGCKFRCS
jgi:hypothetical protein